MALHVLVLAGGSGTRLWPLSRGSRPKHLLPLGPNGESLLRATVERVAPLADAVHVVTAARQAAACLDVLGGSAALAGVDVIAEPDGRGTGPALGLAVHGIATSDPGAVVVSVHADHQVSDVDAYRAAILAAAGWAAATDGLAAVGLTPTRPATGLGYIELGGDEPPDAFAAPPGCEVDPLLMAAAAALPAAHAAAFVEKPPLEQASAFVADGRHLWNLGLFAWTAAAFLAELAAADPDLDAGLAAASAHRLAGDAAAAERAYAALTPTAIEPLVLERSSRLTVVRAGFPWSDIGSWGDLLASRAGEADAGGNFIAGDAIAVDSRGCLVEARSGRAVVLLGATDLVVVDTDDALLVMPATASQQVKALVEKLRVEGRDDLL